MRLAESIGAIGIGRPVQIRIVEHPPSTVITMLVPIHAPDVEFPGLRVVKAATGLRRVKDAVRSAPAQMRFQPIRRGKTP